MKRRSCSVGLALMMLTMLIAVSFLLIGCAGETGTVEILALGDMVVESYDLTGFDQVEVATFFEAEVLQGAGYGVVVEAERELIPYLVVQVRGRRLQVGLEPGVNYHFQGASQRVRVTLPELTRASVSNHSSLTLVDLKADGPLRLAVEDFSTLRGTVRAEDVQVEVTGHSALALAGSASAITGRLADLSSADLSNLDAGLSAVTTDQKSTVRE